MGAEIGIRFVPSEPCRIKRTLLDLVQSLSSCFTFSKVRDKGEHIELGKCIIRQPMSMQRVAVTRHSSWTAPIRWADLSLISIAQ